MTTTEKQSQALSTAANHGITDLFSFHRGYSCGWNDAFMYGRKYGLQAITGREDSWADGYSTGYNDYFERTPKA